MTCPLNRLYKSGTQIHSIVLSRNTMMASTMSSLNDAAFDFIIVGGGTAGLVLAIDSPLTPKSRSWSLRLAQIVLKTHASQLLGSPPPCMMTRLTIEALTRCRKYVIQFRSSKIHATLRRGGLTSGFRNRSISTVKKSVILEARSLEAQAPSMY